jgi:hypothetical protein
MLEHLPNADMQSSLFRPGSNLNGDDRVSTERKEVVVNAYLLQVKRFSPNLT